MTEPKRDGPSVVSGTLSPSICHELNNLLTAILGNAELALLEAEPHSSIHRSLDQIFKSAARAAQLLGDPVLDRRSDPTATANKTILIVDRVDAIREASRRLLEHAGHKVLLARTGAEAIEVLRNSPEPVSVMIKDVTVPDPALPQSVRAVRKLYPKMQIFLWSAAESTDLPAADLKDVRLLKKPAQLSGIVQVLADLIEDSNAH